MRISVRHTTRYVFAAPVVRGMQRMRLMPKTTQGQTVMDWDMAFEGCRREVEYEDHNHNHTLLVSIDPGVTEVSVTCTGTVETSDSAGLIGQHAGYMPLWRFVQQTSLTRPGPRLKALVASLEADRADRLACLHALSNAVRAAIEFQTGQTGVSTTAEEALAAGRGVCQDHAQAFIGAARLMGVPARYVSGYLLIKDRIEQDAGHGWAEAHVEGLGWVGFDIANGISPDDHYVRVATGCDYREAAPITGVSVGGGQTALSVALAVEQQAPQQ